MRSLGIIIFSIALVFLSLGDAQALDPFAQQNFACPMETPATIGGQSMGDIINYYFHIVTSEALGGTLFKAGFFLALLLAVLKFGFGDTDGLKDFAKYLLIASLLIWPLPGQGKSLMILVADGGDFLFQRIVQRIGGLDPGFAGGGAGAVSAFQSSLNEATSREKNNLDDFIRDCYNPSVFNFKERNNPNATVFGPGDPQLLPYYGSSFVMPSQLFLSREITCAEFKDQITRNLHDDYRFALKSYDGILRSRSKSSLPKQYDTLLKQYSSISAEDLFLYASKHAMQNPNSPDSKGPLSQLLSNFDQVGTVPGQIGRSIVSSYFRLIITLMGESFVLIFDYYIYNVVAVIKMFAAMGMALGILYFMFFRKLDIPLAALGAWMSANSLYIVAAIALNVFYSKATYSPLAVPATLLGFKNDLSDALFSIAIIGVMSTSLAALLSWKGISLAIHSISSPVPRLPKMGGGSASAAKK